MFRLKVQSVIRALKYMCRGIIIPVLLGVILVFISGIFAVLF
jgi:hypothetical protein